MRIYLKLFDQKSTCYQSFPFEGIHILSSLKIDKKILLK